jgi:outer membrane receptor for ferrienterochelin and colicins
VILSFYDSPRLTGNFKFDGPGTSEGNLNLAYRWAHFRYSSDDTRQRVGSLPTAREYRQDERARRYEIGGDYAFDLGPGRLKLIGLLRGRRSPYSEQTVVTFTDGSPRAGDRYASFSDSRERIARSEYDWKLLGGDWQWSAEAAFNRLDLSAELFELNPAGEFVSIPFPEGTGGVQEARYESLLSYKRQLTPKLSLQLTGGAEFSRLSQTGAATSSREFWRPKGSLSLAWAPVKGFDASFKLRRRVGQLDFGDFLARVFLEDNNQNSGNAELVPPQSWEFELELKKSLGPWGTTTLRLYDYRIADFVDIIPIGLTGESPGNLDGAHRQGLEWTSTFQFAALGWKGAKLDLRVALEDSSILDPLTATLRPISNTMDRNIELNFRWDIPQSNWALGFNAENYHFQNYYRLGEVGLGWEGPTFAGIFVENKNVFGLTVRAAFNNVLDGRNMFDRTVYAGRRNVSPVLFTEHRDRLIGPIFSFSVKGNF